jgi:RAB6A-GEF complex partner protein 1
VSPRKDCILFTTKSPPAVQKIPWPADEENAEDGYGLRERQMWDYEMWQFNEHDFDWFIEPEGAVIPTNFPASRL